MARAYSEGAYTSSYDYERYWHALPLHLCIRHLVVSSSCPLCVFILSVVVHVMTDNDILSDIGFVRVITALKLLMWNDATQPPPYAEAQSYVCCWRPAPYCFFIGVLVYLPMYIWPTVECRAVLCVVISVVLIWHIIDSCLLLICTMTSLMHCSGHRGSSVKISVGCLKKKRPADIHPPPGPTPECWWTSKKKQLAWPPPLEKCCKWRLFHCLQSSARFHLVFSQE